MLRKRALRRSAGLALVVAEGCFMRLAPERSVPGIVLLFAAIALEAAGLVLERRARRGPGRSNG